MATKYLDKQGLVAFAKLVKAAIDKVSGGGSSKSGKVATEYVVGKCVRANATEAKCGRRVVYIHNEKCVLSVPVSKSDSIKSLVIYVNDQNGKSLSLGIKGRTDGNSMPNIKRSFLPMGNGVAVTSTGTDRLVYGNIPVEVTFDGVKGVRVMEVTQTTTSTQTNITVKVELTEVPKTVMETRSPYRKWVENVYRSMRRPDMGDDISYKNETPRPEKKTRAWKRKKVNTTVVVINGHEERKHFSRTVRANSEDYGLLSVQATHHNEKPGCIIEKWMVAKKDKGYIRKKVGC